MRVKFSHSALKTYLDCSQKYYFQYEDTYVKHHRQEFRRESPHAFMGNMVHVCIARFFALPPEEQSADNLIRILFSRWRKPVGMTGGFESVEQERDFIAQARDLLLTFHRFQADRTHLAYMGNLESFEEMLESRLAPDLLLFGRVDRIDRDADGLHVIDYKTGKEQTSELQLIIYALLAEAKLHEPVRKVSYFYLKTGELETFFPDETLRREAQGRITRTVGAIRQSVFAPRPSKGCRWCEYRVLCPAKEQIEALLEQGMHPTHQDFFDHETGAYL